MKIFIALSDNRYNYTITFNGLYRKLIEDFKSNGILYYKMSIINNIPYDLKGNSNIIKYLKRNKFKAWINISEENQFLAIFPKNIKNTYFYYPNKPYPTFYEDI